MYIVLYENGRYYKAKVEDGHVVKNDNLDEKFVEIYDAWAKIWLGKALTEDILKSLNIPNLGYIKTDTGFEIYDKNIEEYTEEILPVYIDVFGSIKKSKKSISFKTPTKKSVKASRAIYKQVETELLKLKYQEDLELVNSKIEEGNGIAFINTITNLYQLLYGENVKILFASNGCYVVGRVAKKPVLDLNVPEYLIPIIIGKGGQMIKKIASEVGAKRINVKSI